MLEHAVSDVVQQSMYILKIKIALNLDQNDLTKMIQHCKTKFFLKMYACRPKLLKNYQNVL